MLNRKLFISLFTVFFVFICTFQIFPQTSVSYMTEPSLSPDNKEIVFVSGGDIWSVPGSGGTANILVSHEATEGRPMFSPDGKKLVFASNRHDAVQGDTNIFIADWVE